MPHIKAFLNFLKANIFLLILSVFLLAVIVSNYKEGTYLSGWDTLHPEFDFGISINRELFGVWRPEMGLGNLMGHSDVADLPRILLLRFMSFFISLKGLRYFYVLASLFLGPVGTYFFLTKIFSSGGWRGRLSAFFGSLYYLLNFAVLQHFYVPLEMFMTLYAFLPWMFYLSVKFIEEKKTLTLLLIFILSFISAPMAWAATLFYAYLICLTSFLFVRSLLFKKVRSNLSRMFLILLMIVIGNSFWLLPSVYSVSKKGPVVVNSMINRNFSEEAFISNKAYGNIENVLVAKNNLFSWQEYDFEEGKFKYLLDEWRDHLKKPYVIRLLYIPVIFFGIGILISFLKKDKVGISMFIPLALSLFFIINENPPTGLFYSLLRDNFSIFREGLRMPFTKFSIPLIFFFSYYLAYSVNRLGDISKRLRFFQAFVLIALLASLIYPMMPVFKGYLISPSMKVDFPNEYFELFDFMKDKSGRIAKFPLHTRYGWTYYDWGFQGASFTQFGLENPVLDRDYDRWSAENETFFHQASYAFYSKDPEGLKNVLEKYNVHYLLLDTSVIDPNSDGDAKTASDEAREVITSLAYANLIKKIGFLEIYEMTAQKEAEVWTPSVFDLAEADMLYSEKDPLYEEGKAYAGGTGMGKYYPFTNFDKRSGIEVYEKEGRLNIRKDFGKILNISEIEFTDYATAENELFAGVYFVNGENGKYKLILKYSQPDIITQNRVVKGSDGEIVKEIGPLPSLPGFVNIGRSIFEISEGVKGEKYLGSLTLPTNSDTDIVFYSREKNDENEDVYKILSRGTRSCSDPDKKTGEMNETGNSFTLEVGDESVCVGSDLTAVNDLLAEMYFESGSSSNVFPEICFSGTGYRYCLSSGLPKVYTGKVDGNRSYRYLAPLLKGYYWIDFVGQGRTEGKGYLDYLNIELYSYPAMYKDTVRGDDFRTDGQTGKIVINDETSYIETSIKTKAEYVENFATGRGYPTAYNCDVLGRGRVSKEMSESGANYEAYLGALSCDYLTYPEVGYANSYFVKAVNHNKSGRSLKFYVYNLFSQRMDVDELLPSGDSVSYFPLLSKPVSGTGYVVNLETRSFDRISSGNSVESIEFIPFPEKWLNSMKVIQPFEQRLDEIENSIEVKNIVKNSNSNFKVAINLRSGGMGLLVLDQGFDSGWIAAVTDKNKIGIFNLPAFFSNKLTHVRVDGWANGWYLDSGEMNKIEREKSELNISIIYWPQYLQDLGYYIMILTLLVFALLKVSRKPRP